MKSLLLLILLSMILHSSIYSEIEQITIRWTAQLCQEPCRNILEKEFREVPGIDETSIDIDKGQATLTWKKNVPFDFPSINTAMRMVGLAMREIRLKVRGSIKHSEDNLYLVSDGDHTPFNLVNPVVPSPSGPTSEFNRESRKLSSALRQQLLQAQTDKQIVTIEGPIFMPKRMTVPTEIVIDYLNITNLIPK